jgi:diacylglycerol kinase (ATP)
LVTQQRILIIANPVSGMGRGVRIAREVVASARAAGIHASIYSEHPGTLSVDLLASCTTVIVAGGDGTLRCVVDRMLQLLPEPHPLPAMLVIPLGTANLMARHLGCMWANGPIVPQIIQAILAGNHRHIDLASANGTAMLAIAGAGFDAQVVHNLAAARTGPITYANWLLPTLRSLLSYRFPPITVTLEGHTILAGTPAIAFVGNIPEYGAGFSVTPTARPDDQLLDVCVLPCDCWQQVIELGILCGNRHQLHSDRALYRRARHVEITSPARVPVQVDGDAAAFTPLTICLLPRQLTFIVADS